MDMKEVNFPESFTVSGTKGELPRNRDALPDLNYETSFAASASRCRHLGWRLAAVDARELLDLEANFDEPLELWLQPGRRNAQLYGRVNLGVYTGSVSGLVVLEVGNGEGKASLERLGSWRSTCVAGLNGREQHYYALPTGKAALPTRFLPASQIMVFGEDGLAPLPPSVDIQARQPWRWINPPWASPPPNLPQGLWEFLWQHLPPPPFRNYSRIHPALYALIVPEKLKRTAQMANEFIGSQN